MPGCADAYPAPGLGPAYCAPACPPNDEFDGDENWCCQYRAANSKQGQERHGEDGYGSWSSGPKVMDSRKARQAYEDLLKDLEAAEGLFEDLEAAEDLFEDLEATEDLFEDMEALASSPELGSEQFSLQNQKFTLPKLAISR